MKHFISIADHSREDVHRVIDRAFELRDQRGKPDAEKPLAGRTLAMLFEKPSLRTRVSFEQGMIELGGYAIVMAGGEVGIGARESPADVARVLGGMVHGIMARVFDHQMLIDLAEHSPVPVINALSDDSHPCQALADVMTIMDEFGRDVTGKTLAFVGDGNNVAKSLALLCAKLGMNYTIACPEDYALDPGLLDGLAKQHPDLRFKEVRSPREAIADADAIYADTFISMGQEEEKGRRLDAFREYQINASLLSAAPKHAIVLHCLPAYRGIEITNEVMDGPQSRVFPQAHNRLHAQKGLLATLMG